MAGNKNKEKATGGDQGSQVTKGPFTKHANTAENWGKIITAIATVVAAIFVVFEYYDQADQDRDLKIDQATISVFSKFSNDSHKDDVEAAFLMRVFDKNGISFSILKLSDLEDVRVRDILTDSLIDIAKENDAYNEVIVEFSSFIDRTINIKKREDWDPWNGLNIYIAALTRVFNAEEIQRSLNKDNTAGKISPNKFGGYVSRVLPNSQNSDIGAGANISSNSFKRLKATFENIRTTTFKKYPACEFPDNPQEPKIECCEFLESLNLVSKNSILVADYPPLCEEFFGFTRTEIEPNEAPF